LCHKTINTNCASLFFIWVTWTLWKSSYLISSFLFFRVTLEFCATFLYFHFLRVTSHSLSVPHFFIKSCFFSMCGIRVMYLLKSLHFFRGHIWFIFYGVLVFIPFFVGSYVSLLRCLHYNVVPNIWLENYFSYFLKYHTSLLVLRYYNVIMCFLATSIGGASVISWCLRSTSAIWRISRNSVFHQIFVFFISLCHRCVNCNLFLVQVLFIEILFTIFLIFAFRPSKFNFLHISFIEI